MIKTGSDLMIGAIFGAHGACQPCFAREDLQRIRPVYEATGIDTLDLLEECFLLFE